MTTPTISNFIIPNLVNTQLSYTIINPTSNSLGSWSYTLTTESGITINGNVININTNSVGNYTITATQSEYGEYSTGTINTSFSVYNGYWRTYKDAQPEANEVLYNTAVSNGTWNGVSMTAYIGLNGWKSVTFGNNKFVAINSPNPVIDGLTGNPDPTIIKQAMTSIDGKNWIGSQTIKNTQQPSREAWLWNDIDFGNNTFVAVSSNGGASINGMNIMGSTDSGSSWFQYSWIGVSYPCLKIKYGNDRFIMMHSNTNRIQYVNSSGIVMQVGGISGANYLNSTNDANTNFTRNGLCYASDYDTFVVVGATASGSTTTTRFIHKFTRSETNISSSTGLTGPFRNNNFIDAPRNNGINYSWNSVEYGITMFGKKTFVAVGNGCIMTSIDRDPSIWSQTGGTDWTLVSTIGQTFISNYNWLNVSFSSVTKLFVVTGNNGGCIVSSDGLNWTQTITNNNLKLNSSKYGNNNCVIVSDDLTTENVVLVGLDLDTNSLITPILSNFTIPNLNSSSTTTTYTISHPTSNPSNSNGTITYVINIISGSSNLSITNNVLTIPANSFGTYTITATQGPYNNYASSTITSNQFTITANTSSSRYLFSIPALSFI